MPFNAWNRRAFLGAGLAVAASGPSLARGGGAELIIHGGPIYTGVGSNRVEAVAVAAGKIIAAGDLQAVRNLAGPGVRVQHLRGAAMFPGFTDAHAHLAGIGARELTLNLDQARSLAAMLEAVRAWADAHPNDPVIMGRGWIETHWPEKRFPTRQDLDAAVPDRPVLLGRADGHAAVVNTAALRRAGVTRDTPAPEGGEILKDAAGEPSGMLIDTAEQLVASLVPSDTPQRREEILRAGFGVYASRGWTGLHNMGAGWDETDRLHARTPGETPLRVYNYVDGGSTGRLFETGARSGVDGRVITRGVKLYADGALGSRGAALFEPYADAPDSTGLMQSDAARMVPIYEQALRSGIQMTTHAIGDRGNASVLDWYQAAFEAVPADQRKVADPRFRIEHAQVLRLSDIPRFRTLGVLASMQPSHAIGDLHFAPARLGDARLEGAYAWRSLVEAGAMVPGGSDAPVEKGDPLIEFYAAVARRDLEGFQGANWRAGQAVDRVTALRMFTEWPAYASFRERELGRIAPGYAADFSVFSVDLMTAPEADLPKGRALLSIVGGETTWRADGW